ncbi:MAG: sn-glycerol-3-phosphate ABC transporter ATP-binding protein UgpC [Pseudomonadota bacterium]
MAHVTLDSLTKRYGGSAITAVDSLSLEIEDGEFLVLVGPSGCGKSTALRMIAGLEEISDGAVWIGDEFVNDVHPKDRDVAMVFQNYALYPHMSVFTNIAFPLQIAKLPRKEIRQRVDEAARILQLQDFLKRRPGQLSGGQRQRVAMGRAIVRDPSVFLMDEPLSNLDAKLRVQMRSEIHRLQRRLGTTTIYVTHDQVEAMTMGDRVALLKDGVLQQVDTPSDMYNQPANSFVATFIGSPAMNLFHAQLGEYGAHGARLEIGSQSIILPAPVFDARPGLGRYANDNIVVGIRPEDMEDVALVHDGETDNRLRSKADLVEALGSDQIVHFAIDAQHVDIVDPDLLTDIAPEPGTEGSLCIARFSAKSQIRSGDPLELAVDTERLQFFDPATGAAIRA